MFTHDQLEGYGTPKTFSLSLSLSPSPSPLPPSLPPSLCHNRNAIASLDNTKSDEYYFFIVRQIIMFSM